MWEQGLLSERRACRLVGLSRDSWRHPPQGAAEETALRETLITLAQQRRRSLAQARVIIARWRQDYNQARPHSSCGRIPPAQYAAQHRQLTALPANVKEDNTQP